MIYLNSSPAQSTTSLSDVDDDAEMSTFFPATTSDTIVVSPAKWASKRPFAGSRTPAHCSVSHLPPEILIHVLRHLHSPSDIFSALMVSRAWCECSVELLWHKPNFSSLQSLVKMMRVISRGDQTFTYARFIRRLNFIFLGKELTDSLFLRLAQCDRLERLTLALCSSLSDDALTTVLPRCHSLVAVDLTSVHETTDRAVIALATSAKRLQGINLAGCKKVTNRGVLALAENCPLLRRVKLSGLEHITDEPVSALAKACPLLLEIDLNHCKRITDIAIRDVWTYSLHMREMRLAHCVLLTDSAFPAPAKPESASPQNPFPSSVARQLTELPPLVLSRICTHLRMLDVTACAKLTDEAVEGIVSHAPKIRNLVFSKCIELTDRTVELICNLGKHLHYLHLGHASNITDRSVRILARCCTRLRYVDFANCSLLTDMSVFELSSLPKLRRIGLVRVSNLTDEAVFSLAERQATLERIHLSYCDQISVIAIHFLVQRLHKLTHLSLTGIPSFRKPELQQFCRPPPADFNSSQRQAFCVYSGSGVSELRKYLSDLFNTMNMNEDNADETEYDDDYEGYASGNPDVDMETANDGDDDEDYVQSRNAQESTGHRGHRPHNIPQDHQQYGNRLVRPSHPTPSVVVSRNINAAAPIHTTGMARPALTLNAGSSRSGSGSFGQIPVVEISTSPTPSDHASNRSTGTNQSNGAGFFRTYQEHPSSARSNGALTPDLNYAEIGHGRGTGPSSLLAPVFGRRSAEEPVMGSQGITQVINSSNNMPQELAHVLMDTSNSYQYRNGRSDSSLAWPRVQHGSSSNLTHRELHDSVHTALNGIHPENRNGESRGRSVKRSLRNTINVAEHYANSLFGRGSNGHDGGGPSNGVDAGKRSN